MSNSMLTCMPLEGVKLIDLTWGAAGSLAAKYLADFGAAVIRVESHSRPDALRLAAPHKDGKTGVDRSGVFAYLNANKFSISINMKDPKGKQVFKKLVGWADVILEAFTPGVMESLSFSYETLRGIKPDLIYLRSSAQGQTGPHARVPAYGFNLTGLSGFTSITGWPDREPVHPFGAYTDFISPPFGAAAILAALDHRQRTGEGQYLDLSQFEACIQFLSPLILDCFVNGREKSREGNSCAFAAPHGVYRCQGHERWCAIAVFTDGQWRSFCQVIAQPELVNDPSFATLIARKEHEAELNSITEKWTIDRRAEDVMSLMQTGGVPAGVVENSEDILDDSQLSHRDAFWILHHPVLDEFPHLGVPYRLSETPAKGGRASPCLGQDTEMVCKQILGLSDAEFVELITSGVLE